MTEALTQIVASTLVLLLAAPFLCVVISPMLCPDDGERRRVH